MTSPLSNAPGVLVVDDDPDILDTTAHMLKVRGFRVHTALDSASAMEICHAQQGKIDVLVADLSMPGDSRGDLARDVTAAYPKIQVVYVSAIPRHVALSQGLVRPEAPYLQKPAQPNVLANLVQGVLPSSPQAASDY
ncbi:response regulator [Actinoplanes sp. NPDC051859]|uniref:response regulator n=1 Tax=Actinoplanes sp. NPDC051859 TaxID=3363909 RepID=UPI0037B5CC40